MSVRTELGQTEMFPCCSAEGCGRTQIRARGLCNRHHLLWLRDAANTPQPKKTIHPYFRLARNSEMSGECWIFLGSFSNTDGYGRFSLPGGRLKLAHRWAYEYFIGPIPQGLHLDHLCRRPACWNPWHLDPVTPKVNVRRASPANRTHCPAGHAYDEINTYVKKTGRRDCRACHREQERIRRRRVQSATPVQAAKVIARHKCSAR